jgi:ubiquinone/menaquinone biosynthesis C-methylase UbiE
MSRARLPPEPNSSFFNSCVRHTISQILVKSLKIMESSPKDANVGMFRVPDLIANYSEPYDASMLRWREIGAIDKSGHIRSLLGSWQSAIDSVLEVGCGTGAVLGQLKSANLGKRLVGIEIGTSERTKGRTGSEIEIYGYDGHTIPFNDHEFDFVYATHVLEHVPHPRALLAEMRRVSRRFVFLEVPCELHFRSNIQSLQKTLNIGHINSYAPESFALVLETSGLRILRMKTYDHSFAVHSFSSSRPKAALKLAVRRALLKANMYLATRFFTYHCAALCEIAESLKL